MATIIAFDNSASMQRLIPGRSDDNQLTYQQLAIKGISHLLEHFNALPYEYVSLFTYSSKCEVKVDFTRDYDLIRQTVKKVELIDKADLIVLLKTVVNIMLPNWGTQTTQQVCIFTDCGLGLGTSRVSTFLAKYVGKEQQDNNFMSKDIGGDMDFSWVEPLRKIKLNFICMGVHSDPYFTRAVTIYQELIDFLDLKAQLFMPKPLKDPNENDIGSGIDVTKSTSSSTSTSHKSELGRTVMFELIERVAECNYKPFETILKIGGYHRLEGNVFVWPTPTPHTDENGIKIQQIIGSKLEITGFLLQSDIGSPMVLSRHMILPKIERDKQNRRGSDKSLTKLQNSNINKTLSNERVEMNGFHSEYDKVEMDIRDFFNKDKDNDDSGDDAEANTTKSSTSSIVINEEQKGSICHLLHGGLKAENSFAMVMIRPNWYGFLYSHTDSKKKQNLMLIILPPGYNVVPWIGDFRLLGTCDDLIAGEVSSFPVKAEKRSYSQNYVNWIRISSLQSDIQKVLRHAKKMPEKTQHFYKELNRIRRAALCIGFNELLEMMAMLFERESLSLSMTSNPECALQLKHAAVELRKPTNRDLKTLISPMVMPKLTGAIAGTGPSGGVTGVGNETYGSY